MLTDRPLERVIDYPLVVGGETLRVTALQMGNPRFERVRLALRVPEQNEVVTEITVIRVSIPAQDAVILRFRAPH